MINLPFIKLLSLAFPRSQITDPFQNSSYLVDTNGEIIGHFDYSGETFYLNQDYGHAKQAQIALTGQGVNFVLKEYKKEEINANAGTPGGLDVAKSLYESDSDSS